MNKRYLLFALFCVATLGIYAAPLKELLRHSFGSELYSHIVLIPLVSGYFFYEKRKEIDLQKRWALSPGLMILAAGTVLFLIGRTADLGWSPDDSLSMAMLSAWVFWTGGFLLFFGPESSKSAFFPLLFLIFVIPIPERLAEGFISVLQFASAEVTYFLFVLTGAPFLREGYVFHLPGMSIEVAKQCSGIRSSLALAITGILAGHLFLGRFRNKVLLVLATFPITVFKNGVRIVSLSLLGAYVDPRILGSELHKSGGIPFFVVALLLLAPVLWVLRKWEKKETYFSLQRQK